MCESNKLSSYEKSHSHTADDEFLGFALYVAISMYIKGIKGVKKRLKMKFAQKPRNVFRPKIPTTKERNK